MAEHGFEVIAVSSGGKDLDEVAEREGVKTIALEMTRTISPLKDLISLWKLYRLLKKEKPQIVHSHTPKAGIIGMLGAKLAGVPIRLHTVAGLPLMEAAGIKRKVLDFVEKSTYSCATKVYPNSNGLYDFILKNDFCAPQKLKIIGEGSSNGINTDFFSPTQVSEQTQTQLKYDLQIMDKDFVFVFVGRLVGDKGINELVKAFELMTNDELRMTNELQITNKNIGMMDDDKSSSFDIRHLKLLLVGPLETELDPLKSETLKTIKENPNIISVGFQKDVRPYFAIANALVFPSYREGFPNVVMQAGAMGLPSIVTNINGCNEIIKEGKNGMIIPVKDTEAIVHAMQKLIEDKDFYLQLKSNARPMIQSRYEQSVVWNALLEEYHLLMKQ